MNSNKLKAIIMEKGYTQSEVAVKMNMAKNTFNSRVNGHSEFTVLELKKLCELLQISKKQMYEIFFCNLHLNMRCREVNHNDNIADNTNGN